MTERTRRPGFTLVEVMVALAIGGMAVAGTAALLFGLGDRAQAIRRAASRADADANGERLLRALLANLDLTSDTAARLAGDSTSATFPAWCDTPAGWLNHCRVRLFFGRRKDATALSVELRGADSSVSDIRRGFQRGRLRYLVEVDHQLRWAETWSRPFVPTGLAVIVDADTLLLRVWGGG